MDNFYKERMYDIIKSRSLSVLRFNQYHLEENSMKFTAYHGTTLSNARKIINSQTFTFIPRVNHWLGQGTYFFVEDLNAAKWWAQTKKDSSAAVLGIDIVVNHSYVLDLDTLEGAKELNDFYNNVIDAQIDFKYSTKEQSYIDKFPREEKNVRRSKIIDLFCLMKKRGACMYTFDVPINDLRIESIDFKPHERQVNIIDNSLINFDTIELINV